MKHGVDAPRCLCISNYICFPTNCWGREGETHGSLGVMWKGVRTTFLTMVHECSTYVTARGSPRVIFSVLLGEGNR